MGDNWVASRLQACRIFRDDVSVGTANLGKLKLDILQALLIMPGTPEIKTNLSY
jgi:hypothetical protein